MRTGSLTHRSFARYALCFSLCLSALVVQALPQDWKALKPGVEYAEVTKEISGLNVNINLLRLDLAKVRLDVRHAMDAAIGTEKTSSIATRHGAFAAINAGFFRLDKSQFAGDAAGVLMMDGDLVSESLNDRTGILLRRYKGRSQVHIGRLAAYTRIQFGVGNALDQFELSGIDRERKKGEAVLYDRLFGPTTLTGAPSLEIRLSRCGRGKMIGSFRNIECKSVEVLRDSANASIPPGGYVLSLGPEFLNSGDVVREKFQKSVLEKRPKLRILIRHQVELDGASYSTDEKTDITNGVPRLIRDGKADITWEKERSSRSFVETRHPRTAIATLSDGKLLLITVDGRSESSGGISLYDLTDYLLSLGAVNAMNLDGGGSTTMFVDGRVVNKPSDKEGERKVSDAILVTLMKK